MDIRVRRLERSCRYCHLPRMRYKPVLNVSPPVRNYSLVLEISHQGILLINIRQHDRRR